jgi:hypothetical protein
MEKVLARLRIDYPKIIFRASSAHCWSPTSNEVSYAKTGGPAALAGLLHELGHARLGHRTYNNDIELLQKEVDAWEDALLLARIYNISIDDDHIQDCIDTYRDWLYKRSLCPSCKTSGLQRTETRYGCINCKQTWLVTASRFCRPYRLSKAQEPIQDLSPSTTTS